MHEIARMPVNTALFLAICVLTSGCGAPAAVPPPAIEFIIVPEARAGGAGKRARIAGRVAGARPGQRVVLFAKSGPWWVQPFRAQPFTEIAADSSWTSDVHLGTEYAALLVEPRYQPPATTEMLPERGGAVVAVAVAKGTPGVGANPGKTLTFSGYEWEIRDAPSDRGGPNDYDPSNAWTDNDGFLHLALVRRGDRWTSAEVSLTRSLGYGTYAFVVGDTSQLDPAAVLGLLTWDDGGADQNHRELDVEISRWGNSGVTNGQYVVQPYYVAANVLRFAAPPGRLTHSFRWEPGRASFSTARGARSGPGGALVAQHAFTSGVPAAGNERVRMNLYFFRYAPRPPQKDAEVVIERFQYLP